MSGYKLIQFVPAPGKTIVAAQTESGSKAYEEHSVFYWGLWEHKESKKQSFGPVWPIYTTEGREPIPAHENPLFMGVIVDGVMYEKITVTSDSTFRNA